MSKPRVGARIKKWRGNWYLFYRDEAAGGIERRRKCTGLEATNATSRRKLVEEYREKEEAVRAERKRRGGLLNYDASLIQSLAEYKQDIDTRAKVRKANPDAREGLSAESARQMLYTVDRLADWLRSTGRSSLTTGQLEGSMLVRFFEMLAGEEANHGKRKVMRRASTMNKHRRHIRAALNFIDGLRPPRFPDFKPLIRSTKQKAGETYPPRSFSSSQLSAFLKAAIKLEGDDHAVAFMGHRRGESPPDTTVRVTTPETPVSALFLILALTGCRLNEALNLKWADVAEDEGVITFRRTKTGRPRTLHLTKAPERKIAPEFCLLMWQWRRLAELSPTKAKGYVLPHGVHARPYLARKAWEAVEAEAKLPGIGPQGLRQSFVSYGSSLGVGASVVASWAGHSAAVSESWYRTTVLGRNLADTFEGAMGLEKLIIDLRERIGRYSGVWAPGIR